MSHDATNWAIKQRGLKPAAKVVLWHLCDRFHPDNGCFPSQDTLAADCELSRSCLNDHLASLEEAKLIRREQRRDPRTHRQKSTCYRFAFEPDFPIEPANDPCPETGHGSVSENEPEPCPKNAESRVRNSDTNPVREPLEREREREEPEQPQAGRGEDARAVERAFEVAFRAWPTSISDSRPKALKAWLDLSPDDRAAAAGEAARYRSAATGVGRRHQCSFAIYLQERRWRGLPPIVPSKPLDQVAPPFGKMWMAPRMRLLVLGPQGPIPGLTATERLLAEAEPQRRQGLLAEKRAKHGWPTVNAMHDRAAMGQGVTVAESLRPLAELMEKVRVGSELWFEWEQEHRVRGWPWLPDPGKHDWVYFPAGGPGALDAFERAVRGDVDGKHEAAE